MVFIKSVSLCLLLGLGSVVPLAPVRAQQPPAQKITPSVAPIEGYPIAFTPLEGAGVPVIHIRLNNKVDARFLVDTGGGGSYVTRDVVEKLGLGQKLHAVPQAEGQYVDLDSIRLSRDLDAPGMLAVEASISAVLKKAGADGIIGINVLQQFTVLFDFERNQISLLTTKNLNTAQRKSLGFWDAAIPLTEQDGGFFAPVTVRAAQGTASPLAKEADPTFSLLVHTGTVQTYLPNQDGKIKPPSGKPVGDTVVGISPTTKTVIRYPIYPVAFLSVGAPGASTPLSSLAPFFSGMIPDTTKPENRGGPTVPIVGLDYLSHFRLLLDFPGKRLFLAPVSNPKNDPFPTVTSRKAAYLRLGAITIEPSATGEWSVVAVDKAVYPDQIQVGDQFVAINGTRLKGLLLGGVLPLVMPKDGAVELQLLRNGKTITVNNAMSKKD